MATQCEHKLADKIELQNPPEEGELCRRRVHCPGCGQLLEVEFVRIVPMVDDIELSPRWLSRGVVKEAE